MIEVAPLAYMRGRTLNDAFIILDEAQNTTRRADEDVPDPARVRFEDRGHRRRHPGGPARRRAVRAAGGLGDPRPTSTTSTSRSSPAPTWCGTGWSPTSSTPTSVSRPSGSTRSSSATARSAGRHRPARRGYAGAAHEATAHGHTAAWQAPRRTTVMSIEVSNESGLDVSEGELISVARFVIGRMDVHPAAELSMVLVDLDTMADLHMRWMDLPGPTDVMSLPDGRARARRAARRPRTRTVDARRHRAVPGVRRRPGRQGRPFHRARTGPAHRARRPAPARLRPRRAGGGEGDVRAAEQPARGLVRRAAAWPSGEAELADRDRGCSARRVCRRRRREPAS